MTGNKHNAQSDADGNGVEYNSTLQVILAEKRTALAMLRTGIAVMVLPMTVMSFLVIMSKMYDILHVNYLMISLLSVAGLLVILSSYLIMRSLMQLHFCDRVLKYMKERHPRLIEFLE